MFHYDLMDGVADDLKRKGYGHYPGSCLLGNFRVMRNREDHRVMIIRTLRIREQEDIYQSVERFLIALKSYIQEHRVDEIYLQANGTVPIPHFFRVFCTNRKIAIHLVGGQAHSREWIFYHN
jgi:hypothetical protein